MEGGLVLLAWGRGCKRFLPTRWREVLKMEALALEAWEKGLHLGSRRWDAELSPEENKGLFLSVWLGRTGG